MSIVVWAQVAVFTHVTSYDGDVRTGGSWVEFPVQRRLCPIFVSSVGSPDIHKYSAG